MSANYACKGGPRKRRIMMVDDSWSVREMTSHMLRKTGYEVVEAADGREAIQRLSREPVDMLIADLNMPVMNGLQLVKEVRGMSSTRYLPILVVTADSSEAVRRACARVGATGWVTKPFNIDHLLDAVARMLG